MAAKTKNPPAVLTEAQNISTLMKQGFPAGVATVPVNGTSYTAAELDAAVQPIIDDYTSMAATETGYHDAVAELKSKAPGYKSLLSSAKTVLVQVFAGNTAALKLLGEEPKTPTPRTTAEKAESQNKATATRNLKKAATQAANKVMAAGTAAAAAPSNAAPAAPSNAAPSNTAPATPPAAGAGGAAQGG